MSKLKELTFKISAKKTIYFYLAHLFVRLFYRFENKTILKIYTNNKLEKTITIKEIFTIETKK